MIKMTTSEARRKFSGLIRKVTQGHRVLLKKQGKPVAVVVTVEDFRLLQKIEDREDIAAAQAAMTEPGRISWEDLKAELEL